MIKKYKYFIFLLLPLFLTGCWDNKDINKKSIVLSVGLDNVENKLEFTGEIARLINTNSETKGKAQITDIYTFSSLGKFFEGSKADYDVKIPSLDFSAAIRAIVFSKQYAEGGIEPYINRLNYITEFRNSIPIAISKEPTNELFNSKIKNDIAIGYAIENTLRSLQENGVTVFKTALQASSDINFKSIGYLIPYITNSNNTIEYLGFVAMKDSKAVGIIPRENSTGFLFILSEKPSIITPVPHPLNSANLLSINTSLKKRKIKTSYENNKINIYIDLALNSTLLYEYNIEPLKDEDIRKVEAIVSKKIKQDILSATERSKNEFKCDVFGFARYFKADNPKKYSEIKWKEEYPEAIFHVNVKTEIINTNLLDQNAESKLKED